MFVTKRNSLDILLFGCHKPSKLAKKVCLLMLVNCEIELETSEADITELKKALQPIFSVTFNSQKNIFV